LAAASFSLWQQTLVDEALLELLQELEVQEILRGQGLLTDDGLHGLHVLADGVARVSAGGKNRKKKKKKKKTTTNNP
jgi:hypothetical protein